MGNPEDAKLLRAGCRSGRVNPTRLAEWIEVETPTLYSSCFQSLSADAPGSYFGAGRVPLTKNANPRTKYKEMV